MNIETMTVDSLLRDTAWNCPGSVAVVDGDQSLTYAELDARVDALASGLLAAGVRTGDRVALLQANSWMFLACYFAVLRAGAVVVPLNCRLVVAELAFQVTDSGAVAVIYGPSFGALADELRGQVAVRHWISTGPGPAGAGPTADALLAEFHGHRAASSGPVLPSSPAGIWYTSGTTGRPKGALATHSSAVWSAISISMPTNLTRDSCVIGAAPLFHRGPMESLHLGAVLVGARQVLMEQFRPEALLAAIEEHGCTHGFIVPTMTWAVIGLPARGEYDLTSMRCWMSASSPMPGVYPARMAAETTLGPGRVYNAYGTTESLVRPVPGAAVRIVDAGHGRLMAGQVGEVAVSSASLAAGYAGQPADWAAATFTADGALWYLTGDLGYTDGDGYLFLVDRTKDMLISGGENVYSAEVEAVLIQHPGLAEVAVVGCPDARWGERVVAVYAMVPGWDEPVDLAAFCDSRLAPFKRPRAELRVDALPRNAFGKVRKDRVRELARAQAEDAES